MTSMLLASPSFNIGGGIMLIDLLLILQVEM